MGVVCRFLLEAIKAQTVGFALEMYSLILKVRLKNAEGTETVFSFQKPNSQHCPTVFFLLKCRLFKRI